MALILTVATAPTEEPVSLAEAKLHLGVTSSDQDSLIAGYIAAARADAEVKTRRQLITATWDLFLDELPAGDTIEFPLPPLSSVTTFKYIDVDGVQQTWAASNYTVDTDSEPGRLVTAWGISWPSIRQVIRTIEIRFVAGYGTSFAIPWNVKAGMLLLVGDYHENREATVIGPRAESVSLRNTVDNLFALSAVKVIV